MPTRADADDLSAGNAVRWSSSGGTAYGRIDTKETDGTVQARPEGPSMEGTSDEPAFLVQVFEQSEDGWTGTDVFTVHRAGALTKIDGFPDDRAAMRAMAGKHRSYVTDAEIRMASDGERTTVQVMTEDIARDGMVLRADGVDTGAYMDNPVVLWNHGRTHDQPIARTVDMQRVDGGLRATVEWDRDEFSQEIKRKVKDGFLNAVSIGWRTEDAEEQTVDGRNVPVVTRADMTEFSFVSVPADAGALVTKRNSDGDTLVDLEAKVDRLLNELQDLRAEATASPAPDGTDTAATAGASASTEPAYAPAQRGPRAATQEDYEHLAQMLGPLIRTTVKRQLGRA